MVSEINKKYCKVHLQPDIIPLMCEILASDPKAKEVLVEIARYTKTEGNKKVNGISPKELTNSIESLKNSRATTQRVLDKLIGMTVIYYTKIGKYYKYQVNDRGVQLIKQL